MMKNRFSLMTKNRYSWTAALAALAMLPGAAMADRSSAQIDRFVEDGYRRHKIQPNEPTTDEQFVRRIYLDAIGRIPTYEETTKFLESESPSKRAELIRELLHSEGFVSHFFNYWADILRIRFDGSAEIDASGREYAKWVKNAIRENMPYDQFVRELVVARPIEGREDGVAYPWENGAAGYYLRDSGMPLDNMSNTIQIFLGTRLVCAQCHDHPFDKWKQMEYYEMAAYSYGMDTRVNPEYLPGYEDAMKRAMRGNRDERENRYFRDAVNDLLQPLSYAVRYYDDRIVKLPHDYKYSDGDPGDEVRPSVIFGGKPKSDIESYAAWMTDSGNPRFKKVIANRMWKFVMGAGLIEPVDDFKGDPENDSALSSNRYLMDFLEREVSVKEFDLREYLEMLFNTRTYQRQAYEGDVPEDQPYYFPGPVLRRMSAEQLWDSFVTIAIPEPDQRKTNITEQYGRYRKEAEQLQKVGPKQIFEVAEKIAEEDSKLAEATQELRQQMVEARNSQNGGRVQELQRQINELTSARDKAVEQIKAEGLSGAGSDSMMAMDRDDDRMSMMNRNEEEKPETQMVDQSRWDGFDSSLVRASELYSPAPNDHFLRQFGQSDRETIQNANTDASVDQALTLLNSPLFGQVVNGKSPFMERVAAAGSLEEKQNIMFLTFLSRYPDESERKLMNAQIESYGEDRGFKNIAWALLNTQEFSFLQ